MLKLAFVVPWFGEFTKGGAETEARTVIAHLKNRFDIEVLSTCVKSFNDNWNSNYYPAGESQEDGVCVKRFPVHKRNTRIFDKINKKLIDGLRVTAEEEKIFITEMINSDILISYIKDHKDLYDLFIYIPYMFGTTYHGIMTCPEKSVLIPCFHDEAYVYMHIYAEMMEKIGGVVYNAKPEFELANELFDLKNSEEIVMGIGVDTNISGDPMRFQQKYDITDPFILYAGRKEKGKNVDILIDYFCKYKSLHKNDPIKLVLIGGGKVSIPAGMKNDILDLGFVDIQDKYDACSAALFMCMPSHHESFSLVIMESWLCGRPVLVPSECDVTSNFVRESNGGLYYTGFSEFAECLTYYEQNMEVADVLGMQGRSYVMENFQWDLITERYSSFFEKVINRRNRKNGEN